ncbi:MAG: GntR family transcriptional regulator, partial [Streptomyces sp.]|nr:GntR family transcriptional regulator [Streptomyces sp.]
MFARGQDGAPPVRTAHRRRVAGRRQGADRSEQGRGELRDQPRRRAGSLRGLRGPVVCNACRACNTAAVQQTEEARARLRAMIVAGDYAPGQRLTETEVAASLAMSRTPVREALRGLTADGLVRSAGGRGVVVSALDPAALRDTYRVRAALEALTAELAAVRHAEGLIAPAELTALAADADRTEEATLA